MPLLVFVVPSEILTWDLSTPLLTNEENCKEEHMKSQNKVGIHQWPFKFVGTSNFDTTIITYLIKFYK